MRRNEAECIARHKHTPLNRTRSLNRILSDHERPRFAHLDASASWQAFWRSDQLKELYHSFIHFFSAPRDPDLASDVHTRLAGYCFEGVGDLYYGNIREEQEGIVALGPSEVHQIVAEQYPGREFITHPLGLPGIEGITVPDQLILRRENDRLLVEEVVEISCQDEEIYYARKAHAFDRMREQDPAYANAQLTFLIASDVIRETNSVGADNIVPIPLSRAELHNLMEVILDKYIPPELKGKPKAVTMKEAMERSVRNYYAAQRRT